MKIAHVLIGYHPSIGGTQLLFKEVSENCTILYNDEVEILTINSYYGSHTNMYKPIKPTEEVINGVHIKRFYFFRLHKKVYRFLQKAYIKLTGNVSELLNSYIVGPWSFGLKKAMDTTDADIIVASPSGYLFMRYPLYRHKLKNPKPFVCQGAIHFADNDTHQVISSEMLAAIKASEYYIANTIYEKKRLVELGVQANNIVVAGVATDVEHFSKGDRNNFRNRFSITDNEILIGYVGRIEKTKSIDVLLNAFINAYHINPLIKLIIGGYETNYSKELKLFVASLDEKIKKNIFFVSNLSVQEKVDLFHALDIFVLPSVNESFGIVFLEAWSCKKPVIGAAIGAIKSVIANEVDGLLMKPFDITSLSNHILRLANDEQLRYKLGSNGFIKTQNEYTWEKVTKKYRDTYLMAIEKFNKQNVNN